MEDSDSDDSIPDLVMVDDALTEGSDTESESLLRKEKARAHSAAGSGRSNPGSSTSGPAMTPFDSKYTDRDQTFQPGLTPWYQGLRATTEAPVSPCRGSALPREGVPVHQSVNTQPTARDESIALNLQLPVLSPSLELVCDATVELTPGDSAEHSALLAQLLAYDSLRRGEDVASACSTPRCIAAAAPISPCRGSALPREGVPVHPYQSVNTQPTTHDESIARGLQLPVISPSLKLACDATEELTPGGRAEHCALVAQLLAYDSLRPGGEDVASACFTPRCIAGADLSGSVPSPASREGVARLLLLQSRSPKNIDDMNAAEIKDEALVVANLAHRVELEDGEEDACDDSQGGAHATEDGTRLSDHEHLDEEADPEASGSDDDYTVFRLDAAADGTPSLDRRVSAVVGQDQGFTVCTPLRATPQPSCSTYGPGSGPSSAGAASSDAGSSAGSSAGAPAAGRSGMDTHLKPGPARARRRGNQGAEVIMSCHKSCPVASRWQVGCCLEQLSEIDKRSLKTTTFGHVGLERTLGPSAIRRRLMSALWQLPRALRRPDAAPDTLGRLWRVTKWVLPRAHTAEPVEVCRRAWMQAMGGATDAHRACYALLLRGHGPLEVECGHGAKKAVQLLAEVENSRRGRHQQRTEYAAQFWVDIFRVCDWMPNDNKLVLRGPGYTFYHKHIYGPAAKAAGMYFEYKSFMKGIKAALVTIARDLPGCNPSKLRFGRCERHSKFPECTACQTNRKAYYAALANPSCDAAVLGQAKDAMLRHQAEWTSDRQTALDLRRAAYRAGTSTVYECDDKCGSFWQQLPVDKDGRYNKKSCAQTYRFAIQSNTVCGEQGILRFAVVPKNVATGSNFGLTNLLLVLSAAVENGRISKHTRRLIRHTDGGPDNLSYRTHVLHWLLVYIGAFDEVLWFRFEAGHSHTEIADRFFGLMKKLFVTDSNTRASSACGSFAELEERSGPTLL